MSEDQQQIEERSKLAAAILAEPQKYKICEVCGSINFDDAPVCGHCQAYRFDSNPLNVTGQALLLGQSESQSVTGIDLNE